MRERNQFSVTLKASLWRKRDELLAKIFSQEVTESDEAYLFRRLLNLFFRIGNMNSVHENGNID